MRRTGALAAAEAGATAELVAHLAEIDLRRLYLDRGHPSLFAYCRRELHLSEQSAYLRIVAARTSRKFPEILTLLADRSVHLTTIRYLSSLLDESNASRLLAEARLRSSRAVLEIVAREAPKPDVPESIRLLPTPRGAPRTAALGAASNAASGAASNAASGAACGAPCGATCEATCEATCDPLPTGAPPSAPESRDATDPRERSVDGSSDDRNSGDRRNGDKSCDDRSRSDDTGERRSDIPSAGFRAGNRRLSIAGALQEIRPSGLARPGVTVTPIAPARYRVLFTVDEGTRDRLLRARELLSHQLPSGSLAAVVELALVILIDRLERRRLGRAGPRPEPSIGESRQSIRVRGERDDPGEQPPV